MKKNKGKVCLVGAGPGDPGLITVKGLECLKKAAVVVYDHLANRSLLQNVPPLAKMVYVGKKGAFHSQSQEGINALLVREARRGKIVVRLKGGDPFVFGRGGEEAEALAEAGVPFEVVPGVTSAIAVPAYAGIPVTHRDFVSDVAFVTGHEKDEQGASPPDWKALARIGTVVFLMGWRNLAEIARKLVGAGRDPKTPTAVVEWGTLSRQRVVVGTLASIAGEVFRAKIKPPTVIIVGSVVNLRRKINWFEKKPLFGRRILVTRPRSQAGELSRLLSAEGADVVEFPAIEIRPPKNFKALDKAIRNIRRFDWVLWTSVNGVQAFFDRWVHLKKDIRDLAGIRFAAVGPATAKAIEKFHLKVSAVAEEYRAEGLLRAMSRHPLKGKTVLVARAEVARVLLPEKLKKMGARVTEVAAYRMKFPVHRRRELVQLMTKPPIDCLTFASSATVENFSRLLGKSHFHLAKSIPVASIGPLTTRTVRKAGFSRIIQPRQATIPHLASAILDKLKKQTRMD